MIDPDYRRRARVARELSAIGRYAEIYEDLGEFCQSSPSSGFIFASDDGESADLPEIAQAVRKKGAAIPIVLYACQPTTEQVVRAMQSGALDYLQWPFDPHLLNTAIRRLSTEWEARTQQERLRALARAQLDQLTRREREVLSHLVDGCSNRQIAEALGISPRTVEIHRGNMMRKLRARSVSDAVRTALYAGPNDRVPIAA